MAQLSQSCQRSQAEAQVLCKTFNILLVETKLSRQDLVRLSNQTVVRGLHNTNLSACSPCSFLQCSADTLQIKSSKADLAEAFANGVLTICCLQPFVEQHFFTVQGFRCFLQATSLFALSLSSKKKTITVYCKFLLPNVKPSPSLSSSFSYVAAFCPVISVTLLRPFTGGSCSTRLSHVLPRRHPHTHTLPRTS